MKTVLMICVLACVAAVPETQPRPTVDQARDIAERARSAALKRLESTPAFKAAVVDAEGKERELKRARDGDSAQEKLNASAAYNKAREKVAAMRSAAIKSDAATVAASAALAKAITDDAEATAATILAADRARKEQAEKEESERMKDPKYREAKRGNVIVGMTENQFLSVLERRHEMMAPAMQEYLINGKRLEIKTYHPSGATIPINGLRRVVVENGIVTAVTWISANDFVPAEVK